MDITYDILLVKSLSILAWSCCPERLFCGIHDFMISIRDLCPNLMGVPHTHKELAYLKNNSIRV